MLDHFVCNSITITFLFLYTDAANLELKLVTPFKFTDDDPSTGRVFGIDIKSVVLSHYSRYICKAAILHPDHSLSIELSFDQSPWKADCIVS